MKPFNWTCPFCNHAGTITYSNQTQTKLIFQHGNVHGDIGAFIQVVVCPNDECREFSLCISVNKVEKNNQENWTPVGEPILLRRLIPESKAKIFPNYIPPEILKDYKEACLIRDLSPKASGTLARRCLQSMIRDFHEIRDKKNLYQEIEAIKENVDPLVFQAIHAVRQMGNIGAHMEKDTNLIIDIEPGEAEKLIQLIEYLFKEWYVHRHERQENLKSLIELPESKKGKPAQSEEKEE